METIIWISLIISIVFNFFLWYQIGERNEKITTKNDQILTFLMEKLQIKRWLKEEAKIKRFFENIYKHRTKKKYIKH